MNRDYRNELFQIMRDLSDQRLSSLDLRYSDIAFNSVESDLETLKNIKTQATNAKVIELIENRIKFFESKKTKS